MAQKVESVPIQIHHGHTETHVVVQFSRAVNDLGLTPAEAEAFIGAMQQSLAKLREHQANPKALNG